MNFLNKIFAKKEDNSDPLKGAAPDGNGGFGGKRLSRLPIYIAIGIATLFVLILAIVASTKGGEYTAKKEAKTANQDSNKQLAAAALKDLPMGIVLEPVVPPPLSTEVKGRHPEVQSQTYTLNMEPIPDYDYAAHDIDDGTDGFREMKSQMLYDALKASTSVNALAPTSAGQSYGDYGNAENDSEELIRMIDEEIAKNKSSDSTSAFDEYERLSGLIDKSLGNNQSLDSPPNPNQNYARGNKNWQLASAVEAPVSEFMIRTGQVLPAILISGINSDMPGMIFAQTTQNVYDSVRGNSILIPQGSRLIGMYQSNVQFGQQRLFVSWQRIVFPDAKALDIGEMLGSSGAGYAGFNDKVNNHYLRMFGSAAMMSLVSASISMATGKKDNDSDKKYTSAPDAISEALGQQIGAMTMELLKKNMNISPTLTIRPGYRFNVIVSKDIIFSKPYRHYDY